MAQQKRPNCSLHLIAKEQDCDSCGLPKKCIGEGLEKSQSESISRIIKTHGPFHPGSTIFRMEDRFKSIFAIQSGAVKIESSLDDGTPLVHGFYFSGELIGIEAVGDQYYHSDAKALTTTWVCEIPFDRIETLCLEIPKLQQEILHLLGQRIRYTTKTVVQGRYLSADKRFLLFLKDLYQRHGEIKPGGIRSVTLPMTKGDIAVHLGLRPESLSRALAKLQDEGVIRNKSREIELLADERKLLAGIWV